MSSIDISHVYAFLIGGASVMIASGIVFLLLLKYSAMDDPYDDLDKRDRFH